LIILPYIEIMTKRIIIIGILVIIFGGLTLCFACNTEIFTADESMATSEGVNTVVKANNQFGFDIYSRFSGEDGNIFFSPYSISSAMVITYDGAKGKTAEEMRSVLHFPEDNVIRRSGFAKIYNEINQKNKKFQLNTANALWAQKNYLFLTHYLEIIKRYYGGKATNLDFVNKPEESRIIINQWVENQTNNKIKDIIAPGAINQETRLVITNAIYFKGNWVKQFDKKNTIIRDFEISTSKKVKTPIMSLLDGKFNYTETEKIQVLELPYSGNELSMLILLPKNKDLKSIEESLSMENLSEWRKNLKEQKIDIYIPKFKLETKYDLSGTLKEMGMPIAFSGDADFSGMTGNRDIFINQVIHQAYVEVNEEGTEAAASTAVIMPTSALPTLKVFNANHPFIFLIQEKNTGNILFLGRVVDPTK
jgi:serine protease inhibitor